MNWSEVKYCDIANGVGVRTSLFVSGCRHRCEGCFNPVAWEFDAGRPFDEEVEARIMRSLRPGYVDGLSVLGGEPLEPENQAELAPFLERVRGRFPDKGIWLWTGFTYDDLMSEGCRARTEWLPRILGCLDVLVDGPFVLGESDLLLRFRGSTNQRLIDVNATMEAGELVEWEDDRVFSSHRWDA